jgi:hypothetical protein
METVDSGGRLLEGIIMPGINPFDVPHTTNPFVTPTDGNIHASGPAGSHPMAPAGHNVQAFIAQQVEHFTQAGLASHANHFAQANGFHDASQTANLGHILQNFAMQLMQSMQSGGHVQSASHHAGGFQSAIMERCNQTQQEIGEIRELSRLTEMLDAAKMEAKKAKETRDWILQNL